MDSFKQIPGLIQELGALAGRLSTAKGDPSVLMKLVQTSRQLTAALEPPVFAAIQNAALPLWSMTVRVAVDLKLFDLITARSKEAGFATAQELAEKSGADVLLVVRVMRALVALGFAKQETVESYSPNALTMYMTQPAAQAGSTFHYDIGMKTVAMLPEYLRKNNFQSPTSITAGPFQYAFGTSLPSFEYWASDPEIAKTYNTYMTQSQGNRQSWVKWFPIQQHFIEQPSLKTGDSAVFMIDIAGGRGHHLDEFSKAFPDAPGRLILQDLPRVIDDIKDLNPRIERMKMDMFESQPVQGARIYHFHFVIHDWPDEQSRTILRNVAQAMEPGYSTLLLREFILVDMNCPLIGVGADLSMMISHAGLERSEKQWRDLIASVGVGLEIVRFWHSPGMDEGVVEVTRVVETNHAEPNGVGVGTNGIEAGTKDVEAGINGAKAEIKAVQVDMGGVGTEMNGIEVGTSGVPAETDRAEPQTTGSSNGRDL